MKIDELIQTAISRGHRALSEFSSKKLLGLYGLPVSREALAQTADQAADLADQIGFPVVLKACSPQLMHKSEGGLVELGLKTDSEVKSAYRRLLDQGGPDLDGILVQEMVPGSRELVLGLIRDPQFGPCVMIGLGGTMTEIFKDTVFRMAPVDALEAKDMMAEMKSRAMLDSFRGQAPADIETIAQSLIALGQIGLDWPEVAEIDVNPLIIQPNGRVVAVDALVVVKGNHHA